ncbi:hypothetical protein E3T26_00340 [Cryobacterium sp. TMT1-21]|uniref:DNA uptake lipoprotein n=1 Tax=Cryobacterium shii TaxID=1259235 RepID=A0AAQ2C794_9MICO|nr:MULTISPECIES: hypothetical protein [Cryobacterium]TFC50158.1 hypothetical protein E3O49_05250 [Cryobacterium shii]TFC82510.1 hypothetical protein E3T24_13350 [Cryobacterium sp. TmT2-59]TFD15282.1 hypothetical protein E3T42_11020 [Cryobacterium sp. TMT4-10]TFD18109.1 hypothetical protein E3T26_00340 [Cryobacterium sp. TMT1-21]TFD25022.1 hypothetical protein E3T32_04465 [Cryobacterium sp. TMT2-23]
MTAPQSNDAATTAEPVRPTRVTGIGRVLIAVYGLLALAATGRSFVQIFDPEEFGPAPLAYSLSALAAVVYIVATIALIKSDGPWRRVAWITIGFELVGVLVVGTLSVVDPELFAHKTVWSFFGRGYGFVPLVLPILGMWWLARRGKVRS